MDTQKMRIIAGRTAIHFWLHADCELRYLSTNAASKVLQSAGASLRADDLGESTFGESPYEVLVPHEMARRNKKDVRCLISARVLPSGSLVRTGPSTVICSPALSYCQVGRSLSCAQAVELGMNLCSSYWLDWLGNIRERNHPLVSSAKLARFCRENSSLYGSAHARRALQWVKDGSASPMETKLMCLLSLPQRLGGFGYSGAQFNYLVNSGTASRRINQRFFRIDIAFPQLKVGIEFEGEAFHRDYNKDRRRVNALESLGWRIVSVDKQLLYNPSSMRKTALQIAKLLGSRLRLRSDWEWLHAGLRRELSL